MYRIFLLLVILLSPALVSAQEPQQVYFSTLPVPAGIQPSSDPSIPAIGWYRWTTSNFVVHSYDKSQGQYLFENIEQMKTWCLERWALPDLKFNQPCHVFCAPDAETMKKLFNMTGSFGEGRQVNGRLQTILWITLDAKPVESVPPALSIVCLKEFDLQLGQNRTGYWVQRGVPVLSMTLPQIRRYFTELQPYLQNDSKVYFSQGILQMTEDEWKKLPPENKKLFDIEAGMMCLFVRKEFGQKNFHAALGSGSQLVATLGFRDFNHLDSSFKRYMFYLAGDVQQNKTPDSYLQIEAVK
jgi:hypothetical protein